MLGILEAFLLCKFIDAPSVTLALLTSTVRLEEVTTVECVLLLYNGRMLTRRNHLTSAAGS